MLVERLRIEILVVDWRLDFGLIFFSFEILDKLIFRGFGFFIYRIRIIVFVLALLLGLCEFVFVEGM